MSEHKMATVSLEQYFDKVVPLPNNTLLTVTAAPEREDELLKILDGAMLRGFDAHAPLTEIHLPLSRFPFMASKFWHVPVEDCGEAQVLRLFFEGSPQTVTQ
jgi:hypothetical protein